jgi:hypothetical protein
MLRYAENSKRSQRKNKNHPVMLAKTRDLRENNSPDVQRHHSQIIPRHVLRDPRLSGARVPHHAIELGDATPRPRPQSKVTSHAHTARGLWLGPCIYRFNLEGKR